MKSALVFSIDDAYVTPFQVFLHSLEATNSIPRATDLFILHTDALSAFSINKLNDFLIRYDRSATFLDPSPLIPADLPIRFGDHVSPATFYRLFIADILPADIDQAVYLDVDMIAYRSIASLFSQPVEGLVAAADHCTPANEIRLWGDCGGTYFQAGVLVIPLHKWRDMRLSEQFIHAMRTYRSVIQLWDQDVLNIVLKDSWQRLPIWFNSCYALHASFSSDYIAKNMRIIHYSGRGKPWIEFNPSPFVEFWDEAYKETFGHSFNRDKLRVSNRRKLKNSLRAFLNMIMQSSVGFLYSK